MRLRTIQLQNYRRYKSAELEFPDGLVSVTGPNGSGKSTLLEAMAWALFGNQAEIVRTDKESIKRQGAQHTEQCMARIEFDFEDESYIVERTMKGKNLTMNAILYAGGTILARGTEEVSEAIVKLFGMDHKAFFISVFARQKELSALTSLPKGERKKMVLRLLGIENVDDAIKRIREDARLAGDAIQNARDELVAPDGSSRADKMREELQGIILREGKLAKSKSETAAELEKIESIHEKLRKDLAGQEKLARTRDSLLSKKSASDAKLGELEKQLEALKKDLMTVESIEKEFRAAEAKAEKASKDLESILEKKRDAMKERDSIGSEIATLKAGFRQLEKEIKEIEANMKGIASMGPDSDCPTCKRKLGKTYEMLLASFQGQIDERRKATADREIKLAEQQESLKACDARSDALAKRESILREKMKEHDVLKARVERAPALRKKLADTGERLDEASKESEDIGKNLSEIKFDQKEYDKSRKALDELSQQIRGSEREVMSLEKDLALSQEKRSFQSREIERLEILKARYDEKREEAENLAALEEVMGEFRKHLISRIRPALASMSSEFMGVLTDGRYNEIVLNEDYEISIRDAGEYHDLERFSGGEKDLANLCLRLAISDIIATRHGTNSFDLIVLDEIFGSQDSNRKRTLLQALNGLSNRFKQIFLITHVDDIKELMGNVVQISENPDGTSGAEVAR
ncbi:MAG: SMC family ATPase [Thermoplasmata archaeon]